MSLRLQATNVCPPCGRYAALHHDIFRAAQSRCRYQYLTLLHFLDRGEWPHPSGNQSGQPSVANEHEWPRCTTAALGLLSGNGLAPCAFVLATVDPAGSSRQLLLLLSAAVGSLPIKLPAQPYRFAAPRSWNAFLLGTSRLFGGRELCDCYREDLFQVGMLNTGTESRQHGDGLSTWVCRWWAGGQMPLVDGGRMPSARQGVRPAVPPSGSLVYARVALLLLHVHALRPSFSRTAELPPSVAEICLLEASRGREV